MHVAGMKYFTARLADLPLRSGGQGGFLRGFQKLCDGVLWPEDAEAEAEGDHVPLVVVVRVTGVAGHLQLRQVLYPYRVQLPVQLVEVRRLVERVERPVKWVHGDHRIVRHDGLSEISHSSAQFLSHGSSKLGYNYTPCSCVLLKIKKCYNVLFLCGIVRVILRDFCTFGNDLVGF